MSFKSVEEARRRATIIALMTYSIMSGPDVFVKLFTLDHLMESPIVVENIVKLWKQYGIEQVDPIRYVQSIQK